MNKDRGNIKWTAMMLPEHVQLLREWQAEDQYVAQPELDEWTLNEYAELIQIATKSKQTILLTIWKNRQTHIIEGVIERINNESNTLKIRTQFPKEQTLTIDISVICNVSIRN
ncbi:YolD-like family protein [Viridibacillus sp. YIM B01967]|uniref:YolD-like family protein n=1 Tax=Viridibacillus soli TaxID=2798301 RepID=A0ABS1H8N3_9BACL|nr:YolD-like family protein [Viridibacillus soli]MBK3495462.1 YolD-like family protein [Viridibacillus soli]